MEKEGTRRDKGRVGDEKICLLGADCKRTLHSARRKRTNQIENEEAQPRLAHSRPQIRGRDPSWRRPEGSRPLGTRMRLALHINLCQSTLTPTKKSAGRLEAKHVSLFAVILVPLVPL